MSRRRPATSKAAPIPTSVNVLQWSQLSIVPEPSAALSAFMYRAPESSGNFFRSSSGLGTACESTWQRQHQYIHSAMKTPIALAISTAAIEIATRPLASVLSPAHWRSRGTDAGSSGLAGRLRRDPRR